MLTRQYNIFLPYTDELCKIRKGAQDHIHSSEASHVKLSSN